MAVGREGRAVEVTGAITKEWRNQTPASVGANTHQCSDVTLTAIGCGRYWNPATPLQNVRFYTYVRRIICINRLYGSGNYPHLFRRQVQTFCHHSLHMGFVCFSESTATGKLLFLSAWNSVEFCGQERPAEDVSINLPRNQTVLRHIQHRPHRQPHRYGSDPALRPIYQRSCDLCIQLRHNTP